MHINTFRIWAHSVSRAMVQSYYAVANGRAPGIYNTWDECKTQVLRFSNPVYKKFSTKSDAENFIKQYQTLSTSSRDILKNGTGTVYHTLRASDTSGSKQDVQGSSKRPLSTQFKNGELSSNSNSAKKRKTILLDGIPTKTDSNTKMKNGFLMDEDGYVNVFTDGACSGNGGENPTAGIGIWFGDDHPLNISQPVIGRPTNNMAEVQAVTMAAKQARKAGIRKLKINTDSQFLISCITEWMPRWKKNGWKTATKKPVILKKELLEMESNLSCLEITWNHVNGHVGIHGNEMADKLAKAGCTDYKAANTLSG